MLGAKNNNNILKYHLSDYLIYLIFVSMINDKIVHDFLLGLCCLRSVSRPSSICVALESLS